MNERIKELSKYRIEKAREDLKASKILYEAGSYAQSLNRSYYADFHAIRAITAFDKFDSKNTPVLSLFSIAVM
ncbi:MAG TPA: HEPN domain-containing protein [Spirochaetota bacterium]|nr:HEPN domain-containing protein [Spirochaetota bacterium]